MDHSVYNMYAWYTVRKCIITPKWRCWSWNTLHVWNTWHWTDSEFTWTLSCCLQCDLLWCGYAGSSLEVKIETDSNDAMEIKTEADSNDITEYPCNDGPSIGMFGLFHIYILWILSWHFASAYQNFIRIAQHSLSFDVISTFQDGGIESLIYFRLWI